METISFRFATPSTDTQTGFVATTTGVDVAPYNTHLFAFERTTLEDEVEIVMGAIERDDDDTYLIHPISVFSGTCMDVEMEVDPGVLTGRSPAEHVRLGRDTVALLPWLPGPYRLLGEDQLFDPRTGRAIDARPTD